MHIWLWCGKVRGEGKPLSDKILSSESALLMKHVTYRVRINDNVHYRGPLIRITTIRPRPHEILVRNLSLTILDYVFRMGSASPTGPVIGISGTSQRTPFTHIGVTDSTQTENLFHSYSSLVSSSIPLKPSDDEVRLEQQIQEILRKVYFPLSTATFLCRNNCNLRTFSNGHHSERQRSPPYHELQNQNPP